MPVACNTRRVVVQQGSKKRCSVWSVVFGFCIGIEHVEELSLDRDNHGINANV